MPKSPKKPAPKHSSKAHSSRKAALAKRTVSLKPILETTGVREPSLQTAPKIERAGSKQAAVLAMLNAPTGASVASIMKATGWQQHSVRGFFAGVVRKKRDLDLTSEPSKDGRIYRIKAETAGRAGRSTLTCAETWCNGTRTNHADSRRTPIDGFAGSLAGKCEIFGDPDNLRVCERPPKVILCEGDPQAVGSELIEVENVLGIALRGLRASSEFD